MTLPDAKPPPSYDEALNGPLPETGDLLDKLTGTIRRFVVLNPEQLAVIALWVLHTYAIEAADTTPYLEITSPEKRCGKSRLLEVLAQLVARPMEAANTSDAALFRALGGSGGELPRTVLYDETDTVFGKNVNQSKEEQRGMLNAGYRRGACVWRCVGEGSKQESVAFPVFGPKALAGIGNLPDTISDRSIPIRLRRRAAGETVERARHKNLRAATDPLKREAERWAASIVPTITDTEPELPEELDDRAQDGAEPLLVIADAAGGVWGTRARGALVGLHKGKGEDGDESSWGVRLLSDIRRVFEDRERDRLPSDALIAALRSDDEGPWASWGKDGLNARSLARLLKNYGIKSAGIRFEPGTKGTAKGFQREWFEDAWSRYLPPNGSPADTTDTLASQSQKQALLHPTHDPLVSDDEQGSNPHSNAVVSHVSAGSPDQRTIDRLAALAGGESK